MPLLSTLISPLRIRSVVPTSSSGGCLSRTSVPLINCSTKVRKAGKGSANLQKQRGQAKRLNKNTKAIVMAKSTEKESTKENGTPGAVAGPTNDNRSKYGRTIAENDQTKEQKRKRSRRRKKLSIHENKTTTTKNHAKKPKLNETGHELQHKKGVQGRGQLGSTQAITPTTARRTRRTN